MVICFSGILHQPPVAWREKILFSIPSCPRGARLRAPLRQPVLTHLRVSSSDAHPPTSPPSHSFSPWPPRCFCMLRFNAPKQAFCVSPLRVSAGAPCSPVCLCWENHSQSCLGARLCSGLTHMQSRRLRPGFVSSRA